MTNPLVMEQETMNLFEVKDAIKAIEKRDETLGLLSQKTKEYLEAFVHLSSKDGASLKKALEDLDLTRLKQEHIAKIIDFLPITDDELKSVLLAYPLTLPKKDKEAIIAEVKKVV